MKVFFIDTDRTFSALEMTKSKDGRSINNPYSFSPRIKSKNVEWMKLSYDTYNCALHFEIIPDDVETVIWSDRAALFYLSYQTTIWSRWEYDKNPSLYDFNKPFPNKRNINMLMEPPDGCGETYNFLKDLPQYKDKFDVILSHNLDLCNVVDKAKWYPWGTSLLDSEEQFVIYPKSKLVSGNYSNKKWWTGHKFRFEAFEELKNDSVYQFVDITGPFTYNDYIPKIDTLRDYYFSVQIENQKVDDFFSDKIIDCFLTGTIPIYRGTNNIGKYFDTDGIISFDTIDQLKDILKEITPSYYKSREKAIISNFHEAKKYISPDDWILKTYGKDVLI